MAAITAWRQFSVASTPTRPVDSSALRTPLSSRHGEGRREAKTGGLARTAACMSPALSRAPVYSCLSVRWHVVFVGNGMQTGASGPKQTLHLACTKTPSPAYHATQPIIESCLANGCGRVTQCALTSFLSPMYAVAREWLRLPCGFSILKRSLFCLCTQVKYATAVSCHPSPLEAELLCYIICPSG